MLASIVRSYLLHNAHTQTLRAVFDDALPEAPAAASDARQHRSDRTAHLSPTPASDPAGDASGPDNGARNGSGWNGQHACAPPGQGWPPERAVGTPTGAGGSAAGIAFANASSPPMSPPPPVPSPSLAACPWFNPSAPAPHSAAPLTDQSAKPPSHAGSGHRGSGPAGCCGSVSASGGAADARSGNGGAINLGLGCANGAGPGASASWSDDHLALLTINARQSLRCAVTRGDILAAMRMLDTFFPGLASRQPHIPFLLHCQAFIELVRSADALGALGYCQAHLATYRGRMETVYPGKLGTVVSLLAYSRPEASPQVAPLLQLAHREAVADAVNSAVLSESGARPSSSLQRLLQQLVATHGAIRDVNLGCGERLAMRAPAGRRSGPDASEPGAATKVEPPLNGSVSGEARG